MGVWNSSFGRSGGHNGNFLTYFFNDRELYDVERGTSSWSIWESLGSRDDGYKMHTNVLYRSPSYANKRNKYVGDCASPRDFTREENWTRNRDVMSIMGGMGYGSIFQTQSAFPYCDTWTTREWCYYMWVFATIGGLESWRERHKHGGTFFVNPRVRWAHLIHFYAYMARFQLHWLCGYVPAFYLYEYLYTYGPLAIKHADIESWKRPWEDGQSTIAAKLISFSVIAIGMGIQWRSFREAAALWAIIGLPHLLYYECLRTIGGVQSNKHMLRVQVNTKEVRGEGKMGTLVPDPDLSVDIDVNRPWNMYDSKWVKLTWGTELKEVNWENLGFDNLPTSRRGSKIPNPNYAWDKCHKSTAKTKSEDWTPPTVMDARQRSGALDFA